ncbi:MAG: S41 family peptidase [Firmicutes bacterium]|nr:S41 family peptidase [Bacillota bacterium]
MDNRKAFFTGAACMLLLTLAIYSGYGVFRIVWSRYTSAPMDVNAKLSEIYSVLDRHSINDFNKDELREDMYRGLVAGIGDPYSAYFDKTSLESFMQQTEGSYAGIGAVVSVDPDDGKVTIVLPYEGSPSAEAGLIPGDKILKVDGIDVSASSLSDVTSLTKGAPGSKVTLTISRASAGRTFDVTLTRAKIDIPTVSYKMLDNRIGYIRLTAFDRVTTAQYQNALSDLKKQNMKGLVIDLRNNPGGLLDVVCQITDTLVPKGVITYTEDKSGNKDYKYSSGNAIDMPLAVLVNGNSASASEVLSGAVKDYGVGALVGTKTFGKGIVQNLYTLSDGSAVKVTIAKYYTPNGVCIQGEGIIPDYVVDMDADLSLRIPSLTPEEDVQLQKAVEVVNGKLGR